MSDEYPLGYELLKPGTMLNHYRIIEHVATGGMGVVYKAEDTSLKRTVAVKVLRSDFSNDPNYAGMFEDEAVSVARLVHPNILPIYYAGRAEKRLFFAMPFISGKTLFDMIASGEQVDERKALTWATQIVSALAVAWNAGIIHRDIKPSNIIVEDSTGFALLADFGLAKVLDFVGTDTGAEWGSPGYISPEQIQLKPVDFRSDIYSLGATLYHLLTRQSTYASENTQSEVQGHLHRPFPYEWARSKGLSEGWVWVLGTMMQKEPEKRYASYEDLGRALRMIYTATIPEESLEINLSTWLPVPTKEDWNPKLLNGLIRPEAEMWARFSTSFTATPSNTVRLSDFASTVSLDAWRWHFKELCTHGDGDPDALERFAEMIPEFSDYLISLCNSDWFEGHVEDLPSAIECAGLARSRSLALMLVVAYESTRASKYLNWFPLWRHSMACGIITEGILDFFELAETQHALAAGFLHDVGKVVLGDIAGMGQIAAMNRSLAEQSPLAVTERECVPFGHPRAGHEWAVKEKLPQEISDAIGLHHSEIPKKRQTANLVAAIQIANHLCKAHALGYSGNAVLQLIDWENYAPFVHLVESSKLQDRTPTKFELQIVNPAKNLPLPPVQKSLPHLEDGPEFWWFH